MLKLLGYILWLLVTFFALYQGVKGMIKKEMTLIGANSITGKFISKVKGDQAFRFGVIYFLLGILSVLKWVMRQKGFY